MSLQNATGRVAAPEGSCAMKSIDKHAVLKDIAERERSLGTGLFSSLSFDVGSGIPAGENV